MIYNNRFRDWNERPLRGANIKAATVREGDIGLHVHALGTVTPISTVNYDEGQMVREGQSLIKNDEG